MASPWCSLSSTRTIPHDAQVVEMTPTRSNINIYYLRASSSSRTTTTDASDYIRRGLNRAHSQTTTRTTTTTTSEADSLAYARARLLACARSRTLARARSLARARCWCAVTAGGSGAALPSRSRRRRGRKGGPLPGSSWLFLLFLGRAKEEPRKSRVGVFLNPEARE